jgi:hypothetical protein
MPTRKEREQQVHAVFAALVVDFDEGSESIGLYGRTEATAALTDILVALDARLEKLERTLNIHTGSDD